MIFFDLHHAAPAASIINSVAGGAVTLLHLLVVLLHGHAAAVLLLHVLAALHLRAECHLPLLCHGIATRHDRTVTILKDGQVKPDIVQGPADAIGQQVRNYGARDDRLVITHSSIRPVLEALRADAGLGARLRAAGIDPDDTATFAPRLVAHAAAGNPGGIVLVSTLKPDRLGSLLNAPRIAAGETAALDAVLRAAP